MTAAKGDQDIMGKKDESRAPGGETPSKGKKRKDRDADEEKDEEVARQEKRKANNNKKGGDGDQVPPEEKENKREEADTQQPAAVGAKDDEAAEDVNKAAEDGNKAQAGPNMQQQQQQQQQAAAVAAAMGNPLFAAGMPLSAVAGLGADANLMHNPYLFAQQGQMPFIGAASGMPIDPNQADQNRLAQGLVAIRPANAIDGNGQQLQQGQQQVQEQGLGQESGAPEQAAPPGFPAAMMQQLYAQQGMDPTQMMMIGLPPGWNPFLAGVIRPGPGLTAGRIEDVPLASLAAGYRSPAISLALPCDDEHLSEYQILVRQQLELFQAEQDDVDSNTQGRKKAVTLGQVGIRCRHCAGLPLRQRGKGSVYYPTKLLGLYQAAQNMATSHLADSCPCIDERMKITLMSLRQRKDTASGGKQYWADGAKACGLYESEDGLRVSRQQAQPQQQAPQQQAPQQTSQQAPQQQQQTYAA